MDAQQFKTKNRVSEELARNYLEAVERDARSVLFRQNQTCQIAAREYQIRARDTVNQAVQESSQRYEVMMLEELQAVRNRYEGGMEENERRVAHLMGSEVQSAFTWSKKHMLQCERRKCAPKEGSR